MAEGDRVLKDDNAFRYLSPEPGPNELGIRDDFSAPLELKTTAEMMAERDEKRRKRRGNIIDILHSYRRGEIKSADDAADLILSQ